MHMKQAERKYCPLLGRYCCGEEYDGNTADGAYSGGRDIEWAAYDNGRFGK